MVLTLRWDLVSILGFQAGNEKLTPVGGRERPRVNGVDVSLLRARPTRTSGKRYGCSTVRSGPQVKGHRPLRHQFKRTGVVGLPDRLSVVSGITHRRPHTPVKVVYLHSTPCGTGKGVVKDQGGSGNSRETLGLPQERVPSELHSSAKGLTVPVRTQILRTTTKRLSCRVVGYKISPVKPGAKGGSRSSGGRAPSGDGITATAHPDAPTRGTDLVSRLGSQGGLRK